MKFAENKSMPEEVFETLNPYYWAVRYVLRRMLWDLRPRSWIYRKKLKELKGKYRGERAVILCNGPSLLDVNFEMLENTYTFGLNKINLLFDQTRFRPSCIVAVNPFVLQQNSKFYTETEIPLFLDQVALRASVPYRANRILLSSSSIPFFSRDCSMSVFQGYTVTYVAIQLAFHMGFEKVALVGCDHSFSGASEANKVLQSKGDDDSHFSKDYFSNGQLWQYPDLKQSEVYYSLARGVYEKNGRFLCNASTKTKLDVLPKVDLEEFLND